MYILKGKNGKNYIFEGPFMNISGMENRKGIYAILCNSLVVKTGIAKEIKRYLDKYKNKSKIDFCHSIPEYIIKYHDKSDNEPLEKIEKEIRQFYNPPLNKLKTKTDKYFKKYGYPIFLLLFSLIILSNLMIMNCADTPVSTKNDYYVSEKRKIGDVLDSISHLYFKDSLIRKPDEHKRLPYTNKRSNSSHNNSEASDSAYLSLDSNYSKISVEEVHKKKLNTFGFKTVKDTCQMSGRIKTFPYKKMMIFADFYREFNSRNYKNIRLQIPDFPLF